MRSILEELHVPLTIETHHDERTVLLACQTCAVTLVVPTLQDGFARDVQNFFDIHADCVSSLDLTG